MEMRAKESSISIELYIVKSGQWIEEKKKTSKNWREQKIKMKQ